MVDPGTVLDLGDHTVEVLESPATAEDRYRIRIVAEPDAPGIDGDFPHRHPCLIETFRCVSGSMTARLGRDVTAVAPGATIEVPVGAVHGFVNSGVEPLVVDSEVIFPRGYRPEDDLMTFASAYVRLRRADLDRGGDGDPPLLQVAVLADDYRHVVAQPGIAGRLIRPLARLGRWRGYRADTTGS